MILKKKFTKRINKERVNCENIQYYGRDAENFLESIGWHSDIDYLGKECTTSKGKQGIIVGFEDNDDYSDYYFIVFIPETKHLYYELANNSKFVDSIKL